MNPHAERIVRIGTHKPAPTRALDTSGNRIEIFHESLVTSPALNDRNLEGTVLEFTAVALALARGGREILPEKRMVDMACTDAIRDNAYHIRKQDQTSSLRTTTIKF